MHLSCKLIDLGAVIAVAVSVDIAQTVKEVILAFNRRKSGECRFSIEGASGVDRSERCPNPVYIEDRAVSIVPFKEFLWIVAR